MMTDTNTRAHDPAEIERDIRQTQDQMSRTVDRIGDQLTFRNLFNALLDKADENDVDARYLFEGARKNPIALGLIAAGAIWLVSDKDSKFPTIKSNGKSDDWDSDRTDYDVHHRDYVSHMSALEIRDGEDQLAYQRRRDEARAAFLMCERDYEEDDSSFRQRLDGLTEKFRDKRQAWAESSRQSAAATRRTAQQALERTQDFYNGNPLVAGILAAAAGAAAGSALPVSRQEQEKLGGIGEKAREMASEQTSQLASTVREKKDELIEKADRALEPSGSQAQAGASAGERGTSSQAAKPFVLGDGTQ